MPEEISEMPQFSDIIVDSSPPSFVQSIAIQQQSRYDQKNTRRIPMPERIEMENSIHRVEERLLTRYPSRIEDVYAARDAFFGSLLVEEETEKKDRKFKMNSAHKQHAQVHALFKAGEEESEAEFSEQMFSIALLHEALSEQSISEERTTTFWNGVRSELGLARMFHDQGSHVFLPQYMKNKREEDEVARWDVDSGIDFCAVEKVNGKRAIFLVDAKGQYNFPKNDSRNTNPNRPTVRNVPDVQIKPVDTVLSLPKSLQYLTARYHPHDIYKARIVIPTNPSYLSNLRDSYSQYKGDNKEVLANFSLIDADVQERILEQMFDQV